MDSSLSCASIEVVVKRVEMLGDGVWAQGLFCPAQSFEIPSHHCGKLYGGLACKAWLVVQASLNFGEEQTMVGCKPAQASTVDVSETGFLIPATESC
jgi:hypothetical protein